MPGAKIQVRGSTVSKSLRAESGADGTRVSVGFAAKGDDQAQVGLAHEKLPDPDTPAVMKAYWRERLALK